MPLSLWAAGQPGAGANARANAGCGPNRWCHPRRQTPLQSAPRRARPVAMPKRTQQARMRPDPLARAQDLQRRPPNWLRAHRRPPRARAASSPSPRPPPKPLLPAPQPSFRPPKRSSRHRNPPPMGLPNRSLLCPPQPLTRPRRHRPPASSSPEPDLRGGQRPKDQRPKDQKAQGPSLPDPPDATSGHRPAGRDNPLSRIPLL